MATFWIAIGSVSTAVLAGLTYRSLRQYDRREQRVENRELIEKIVQPILQDVETLNASPLQDFYVSEPRWIATRRENPVIVYRLPDEVIQAFDALCTEIAKIQLCSNNNTLLLGIYANRIVEKLNNKPASYDSGFANRAAYSWHIKDGKSFWFTFPSLLVADTTVAEEIERSKEGNTDAVLENEVFRAGGREWPEVSRKVFDQILAAVKSDVAGNADLVRYIQMFRDLRPKADAVKAQLEALKLRLARQPNRVFRLPGRL